MRRMFLLLLSFAAVCGSAVSTRAQDTQDTKLPAESPTEAAVHEELRQFRDKLVKAVIDSDVETQISLAHPEIVTMWQDGRVASKYDGLKDFLTTIGKGEDRGFLGYEQEPTPAALAAVYDDRFAFSHGTSIAKYDLFGMEFDLKNYWTAAIFKDNGQWKLVGYHVSGNLTDNPLMTAAEKSIGYVGAFFGLLGCVVGFLFGKRSGRKQLASMPSQ